MSSFLVCLKHNIISIMYTKIVNMIIPEKKSKSDFKLQNDSNLDCYL